MIDQTELWSRLKEGLRSRVVVERVISLISKLTPDFWLQGNLKGYQSWAKDGAEHADLLLGLNWFALSLRPTNYLEIGVRRARSMLQVAVESPGVKLYGFDLWIKDYACVPEQGILTENPGPEFVLKELENAGVLCPPKLYSGNSHETIPRFIASKDNPGQFDLMNVDGNHTAQGAQLDLLYCLPLLSPGGVLLFDDLGHATHPDLQPMWDEMPKLFPGYVFFQDGPLGIAIKPPLTRLAHILGMQV